MRATDKLPNNALHPTAFGGIHFEFSNVAGRAAGKSLGKEIM
ncbi:MAG: hypothetical protein ABR566_14075 [Pyrinomonadaceae bacterium]